MNDITKGTRIINFAVDAIVISVISTMIMAIFNAYHLFVISYIVQVLYYFLFELTSGQTIGKKITNTIVVDMNNVQPGAGRILWRTILRLNPFDAFTYLFGQEQGGHDLISKTRLVSKK